MDHHDAMENLLSDLKTLPKLVILVCILVSYARFASSLLQPGIPRFLSLLLVVSLLPFLPLIFSTIHFRGISGFFLSWLCLFKLLLLAFGRGPLDPSLPLIRFIPLSTLPVKLQDDPASKSTTFIPKLVVSSAVRAALLCAIFPIYRDEPEALNHYVLLTMYCVHIYLFLELVLSISALVSQAFGMKLEPHFNKPYFTTSLRDFWGRRWNLMVTAILRPSVYDPVRSYYGPVAGILAAFLTSGLMHELIFYYNSPHNPTGEVTMFFVLHGICVIAEWWWVKHRKWWCPPRVVAPVLTLSFVVVTAFWLFFPPMIRAGADQKFVAEVSAMIALIESTGRRIMGAAPAIR